MVNLNRVLMIGNLTRDPELRYTPSGTPVANLRLAVTSTFKDQSGQRRDDTCFVTVVVWSRQAEACHQYLKKGRSIFVEGRLIFRSWESEGKTRSTLEIRADRVQFLGAPAQAPAAQAPEPPPSELAEEVREPAAAAGESGGGEAGQDADVPF